MNRSEIEKRIQRMTDVEREQLLEKLDAKVDTTASSGTSQGVAGAASSEIVELVERELLKKSLGA